MLRKVLTALPLLLLGLWSCSVNTNNDAHNKTDADWVTITPKNYLDFEYAKVIAFASVEPNEAPDLIFSTKFDLAKFPDTISVTLDSAEIVYLNDLLSGKYRKPYHKDSLYEQPVADCFYARHNIIFLDNKDSIVNYVSVCFECGRIVGSKSDLASMDNYRDFFNHMGLTVFEQEREHILYYDSLARVRKHKIRK